MMWNEDWIDSSWVDLVLLSAYQQPHPDRKTLIRIMMHELGHMLGLHHSWVEELEKHDLKKEKESDVIKKYFEKNPMEKTSLMCPPLQDGCSSENPVITDQMKTDIKKLGYEIDETQVDKLEWE